MDGETLCHFRYYWICHYAVYIFGSKPFDEELAYVLKKRKTGHGI